MSVTYDWSPLFGALQNNAQQFMWQNALQKYLNPQQPAPQAAPNPSGQAPYNIHSNPIPTIGGVIPSEQMRPNPPPAAAAPPQQSGDMSRLLPLLQMMGPQAGMPLLLQAAMRQSEYDPTPRIGTNPNTGQLDQYLVSKDGTGVRWLNVKPREKMEVSGGQAYNPYEVSPGQTIGEKKPMVNNESGQISFDEGKTWVGIPNFVQRASAIAGAKRADKPPNPNAPILLPHPSGGY